jgi:hypothetical protein
LGAPPAEAIRSPGGRKEGALAYAWVLAALALAPRKASTPRFCLVSREKGSVSHPLSHSWATATGEREKSQWR